MPDLLHYTALTLKTAMDCAYTWGYVGVVLQTAVSLAEQARGSRLSDVETAATVRLRWFETHTCFNKEYQASQVQKLRFLGNYAGLTYKTATATLPLKKHADPAVTQGSRSSDLLGEALQWIVMDDPLEPAVTVPSADVSLTSHIDWSTIDRLVRQAGAEASAMARREKSLLERLSAFWKGKSIALVRSFLAAGNIRVVEHLAPVTDSDQMTVVVRTEDSRIVEVLSVVVPTKSRSLP